MTPCKVNKNNEKEIFDKMSLTNEIIENLKYRIGDKVRIYS